jgi:hypothetical protein
MNDIAKRLASAFAKLPRKARLNLLYHAGAGTRILCGDAAHDWVDGMGGA